MLRKLALRNVKRQLGNYLIYFITVALTVALLFGVNNLIYSDNLAVFVTGEFDVLLNVATLFISMVTAFVLGYANSFMLKLRKKEFGLYLTLGMPRGSILKIFFLENMIICIAALAVGAVAGIFVFQGLMAVMMGLLEMEFAIAAYTTEGIVHTVLLVAGIFLLASLASAFYLKRISIYSLLHGDKKVEKSTGRPLLWGLFSAFSLASAIFYGVDFFRKADAVTRQGGSPADAMMTLAYIAIFIILFHVGMAKCLVPLLLGRKKLCGRGTNVFVLRQLSGALSVNAVMLGCLAFLLSFAVIGVNTSFIVKRMHMEILDRECPYDIFCYAQTGREAFLEEAEAVIGEYVEIRERISCKVYGSGSHAFSEYTGWYRQYLEDGWGWEDFQDSFVALGDFNRLIALLGFDPVSLEGEYLVVGNGWEISQVDWSGMVFEQGGKRYTLQDCRWDFPPLNYQNLYVVVPDEAVADMACTEECVAYMTDGRGYDASGMWREIFDSAIRNGWMEGPNVCGVRVREYVRTENNKLSAVLVVGALFGATVFLFLAMAVLALKTLSTIGEDRKRYELLGCLGAGERERNKTLFRQTFSFFLLPFVVPMLMGIPAAMAGMRIMDLMGMGDGAAEIPMLAGAVALVMAGTYLLYYAAAYLIAKKAVNG